MNALDLKSLAPTAGSRTLMVVSPHLDDAVISCGATIWTAVRQGWAVVVATVCTEAADDEGDGAAALFNGADGDVHRGMAERRREDRAALAGLGCTPVHLGYADDSFRPLRPEQRKDDYGRFVDPSRPLDVGLCQDIACALTLLMDAVSPTLVLAPLAVGDHIDHRRTAAAVGLVRIAGLRIGWFEDLPYALDSSEGSDSRRPRGASRLRIELTSESLSRKSRAIQTYSSQARFLHSGNHDAWFERLETHSEEIGGGEPSEVIWIL